MLPRHFFCHYKTLSISVPSGDKRHSRRADSPPPCALFIRERPQDLQTTLPLILLRNDPTTYAGVERV